MPFRRKEEAMKEGKAIKGLPKRPVSKAERMLSKERL